MKNTSMKSGIILAVFAAALYALNTPLSKILLGVMPPTLTAGFLYLGAGTGMLIIAVFRKFSKAKTQEAKLTKKELPFTIAMILLDIAAPICLLFGLKYTTAASASLLNNFEIVATAIIALVIFKEKISFRLWLGICFVTISCGLLSVEDLSSFSFSYGSLLIILLAYVGGSKITAQKKSLQKTLCKSLCLKEYFRDWVQL